MKRVNGIFKSAWSLMLSGALVFSGCQDTVDYDRPSPPVKDGEAEVHITLNISGQMQTALRAIGQPEEEALDSISVLAFDADEANDTLLYKANIAFNRTTNKIVAVVMPDIKQRFVVIANFDTTNIIQNIYRKSDLSKLIATNPGKWNATSSSDFRKFPMWGESDTVTIAQKDKGAKNVPITLLRMVARIDVDASATAGTFSLDIVYLYNTNTTGQVVPDSVVKNVSNKDSVTTASIPTGVTPTLGPIEYSGIPGNNLAGAIYTFETVGSPLGNANSHAKATCLVIGGKYNGITSPTTYYRVDFIDRDSLKYRDILRNHQYKVNIKAVNGHGYETKEQAFAAKSASIDADVLDWDDTGDPNDDVVMNDQYYLAVTQNSFTFSKEAIDSAVIIKTNFPGGWEMTSSDATWLIPSDASGDSSTIGKIARFQVAPYQAGIATDATDIRTAEITVKAGRLTRKIIVQQANVDSAKIEFYNGDPTAGATLFTDDTLVVFTNVASHTFITKPLGVRWKPDLTGGLQNEIILWTTPSFGLTYYADVQFSGSFLGIFTDTSLSTSISHANAVPSDMLINTGIRLWARVSNGFITVEKSIVIKFVRQ
ncbi:DUF4906 domain-containing protein [Candidatus Symbiothrix dinenymphae]|uniref:DUF4906 domain-containing protein n=1 Tax=Candidatus Symbiothrix dinenymphae TaxID=467085 RepID=UPI0006C2CED1|nr:DUF4906 domain-containing protein [Candidatus Symbiothrix dinenymphae]GAP72028.1 hypothetical protein SAMD00024442_22_20 [Candidatus Symbiothrix dinenymphae]